MTIIQKMSIAESHLFNADDGIQVPVIFTLADKGKKGKKSFFQTSLLFLTTEHESDRGRKAVENFFPFYSCTKL